MVESFYKFQKCLGIDNVSDLTSDRIRGSSFYAYECDNIDIDNSNIPHRRDGSTDQQILNSTTVQCAWSDGETCLFVDGTVLKRLNNNYSVTSLIYDIDPTDRMCYLSVSPKIYFSNLSMIGYILNGLPYPFPDPQMTFKIRMVGGQILAHYNSRLYSANQNNLFFSDATVLERMDKRKNAIAFRDRITMVQPVLDGLYIGTQKVVSFLSGSDPISDFQEKPVMNIGVKEGTSIVVEDDTVGKSIKGKVAYWTGTDGAPYKGFQEGNVISCHRDEAFKLKNLGTGCAILKKDHGYKQYIVLCEIEPGMSDIEGEFRIPRIQTTGLD